MAFYSESELKDILVRLSQESSNVRFIKFERLGVKPELVSEDNNDSSVRDVQNEATLYDCSVCKKKLISAHLLDLHVAEYHDSYFELEKDKKPMVRIHEMLFTGRWTFHSLLFFSVRLLPGGM